MVGNWGKTELEFVVEVSRFVVEVFVCVFFVDIMKGLVLLVLLVGLCSADSWPCEFTDSEGNHYDFTPQRDTFVSFLLFSLSLFSHHSPSGCSMAQILGIINISSIFAIVSRFVIISLS